MRLTVRFTILLLAAAMSSFAGVGRESLENSSPAFEVQMSILPTMLRGYPLTYRNPPTFGGSVLVIEPGTNHAYAFIEDLEVPQGAKRKATKVSGELGLQFEVTIAANGERAVAAVGLSRGSQVLIRCRSTVWLQQPRPAAQPVKWDRPDRRASRDIESDVKR